MIFVILILQFIYYLIFYILTFYIEKLSARICVLKQRYSKFTQQLILSSSFERTQLCSSRTKFQV